MAGDHGGEGEMELGESWLIWRESSHIGETVALSLLDASSFWFRFVSMFKISFFVIIKSKE